VTLPLFPLGTVLFPRALLPLHVFEPRYRAMVSDLMAESQPWSFGVVAIREGHEVGAASVKSLHEVGCAGIIMQVERFPDGRLAMVLAGDRRFRIRELDESRPYLQADVEFIDEPSLADVPADLLTAVRERFVDYCSALGAPDAASQLPDGPADYSFAVAATMVLPLADRQALLESPDAAQRLRAEAGLLSRELALIRTGTMPVTQPRLRPYSQN